MRELLHVRIQSEAPRLKKVGKQHQLNASHRHDLRVPCEGDETVQYYNDIMPIGQALLLKNYSGINELLITPYDNACRCRCVLLHVP